MKSDSPKLLEIRNPWGKVVERKGLRFEKNAHKWSKIATTKKVFYGFFKSLFTFEVPFTRLFSPTSWSPMTKLFRFSESLVKTNIKKWSPIGILLVIKGVKLPREKKSLIFDEFCLASRIFLLSVLLSALVEGCFVSRTRDFFYTP